MVYQDIASEALLAFGVENSGFEYSRRSQDHLINRLFSRGHQELENIYGQHTASSPYQALLHAPIEIMLLAELDLPTNPDITRHKSYL